MIWLADMVLGVHFLFVGFIVGGLILIWLGAALNWKWVHGFWFRILHAGAMLIVLLETALGLACPLTIWEDLLRGESRTMGFIPYWISRFLFYDFPNWVFTVLYTVVAVIIFLTFKWVPIHRKP